MASILEYITRLNNSDFKKGMKENKEATESLDKAVGSLKQKMEHGGLAGEFAKGLGIERIAEKGLEMIKDFGKEVLEATANYEKFSARLSTLLNGNKEEAEVLHKQLVEISSASGIKLSDLEESTIQLNIFGVAAGRTKEVLEQFGNISIATGIDVKTLSEQYGRVVEAGALTSKTLRVFQKEGVNLQAQLQKDLGVSADGFKKLLDAGRITTEQVNKAFEEMTTGSGQFAGQMEAAGNTINGQLNKLAANWEELKINLGKSQHGIIAGTISMFSSMVSNANETVEAFDRVSTALEKAGKKLSFWQNLRAGLGFGGQTQVLSSWDTALQSFKSGTLEEQRDSYASLHTVLAAQERGMAELLKDKIKNADKIDTLDKAIAITKGKIEEVAGKLATSAKKTDEKKEKLVPEKPISDKETARENITINIAKMVESLYITPANLKESSAEIKKLVADIFAEAVNSVKYVRH